MTLPNDFNDPIIGKRRKGTADSPFKPYTVTIQVINSKVTLPEIPNRFEKVKVTGASLPLYEVENNEELTDELYQVDYTEGVVFFNSTHNGKSYNFEFLGEGRHFFPATAVYVSDNDGDLETVKEKFDRHDLDIAAQKARVDQQIQSVPQPSEVVDSRVDRNGVSYPTVKSRIDAEQKKIDDALLAKDGATYASLKERLDKVDDNTGETAILKSGINLTQATNKNSDDIGDTSLLKKGTDLTEAINLNIDDIGDIALLETTIKTNLVAAINETSTQSKKIEDISKNSVSVYAFGADESASDNSLAFSNAINYIKDSLGGKGKVLLPAGKAFKFTKPIGTFFGISNVEMDLNGCILDFSALSTTFPYTYLGFKGTYGSTESLTSDALVGTKTITVTNTFGFLNGDMIRIYSNKQFDPTRTQSRIGEIAFIDKVDSSTQITLKTPLNNDYTTTDVGTIQKLNAVENIYIHNGTIKGNTQNNEHYGIELAVAKNSLIDNVKIEDAHKRQIVITDSVKVNVTNCFFKRAVHTSQGYGVSFVDSTRDSICTNSHFEGVRHSLSVNTNSVLSWGQPRRIFFVNNTVVNSSRSLVDNSGGDAINAHAGSDNIIIIGNTVNGSTGCGINFEARSGIISDNTIIDTENIGININPRSDLKSKVIVTGNRLERIGKVSGNMYGINIMLSTAGCEKAIIANNQVDSMNQAIRTSGNASYIFDKLIIQGNEAEVTFASYGITAEYAKNAIINGNSVKAPDVGIYTNEITHSSVVGNSCLLYGTGATSWGIRVSGNSSFNVISGNTLRDGGTGRSTGAYGVILVSTVSYSGVFGNVTDGFATNISIAGTGNIQRNNVSTTTPTFTVATLSNGWSTYISPGTDVYYYASYMKDELGFVHIRGHMAGGTNTRAFTLPVGMRPNFVLYYSIVCGTNTVGTASIKPDGGVFINVSDNSFVSLNNIPPFLAEQ